MDPYSRARARLRFFVDCGLLPEVPSSWQITAGTLASMPVVLGESGRGRTYSRRTLLGQIPLRVPLQVLYNPGQAFSINGLLCSEATVRKHVLSVYHEDAMITYDLQLVQTFPGALERLEADAAHIATGRGLGARILRNVVGGDGYHARVVELCAAARRFEYPPETVDPRFCSLVGFLKFCLSLPAWPESGAFYGFDWDARRRADQGEVDSRPSWQRTAAASVVVVPVDVSAARAASAVASAASAASVAATDAAAVVANDAPATAATILASAG